MNIFDQDDRDLPGFSQMGQKLGKHRQPIDLTAQKPKYVPSRLARQIAQWPEWLGDREVLTIAMQDLNTLRQTGLEGADEGGFSDPCFAGNQDDLPMTHLRLRQQGVEPSDISAPFQQQLFQMGLDSWQVNITNLGSVPSERRFARRKMGRLGP